MLYYNLYRGPSINSIQDNTSRRGEGGLGCHFGTGVRASFFLRNDLFIYFIEQFFYTFIYCSLIVI